MLEKASAIGSTLLPLPLLFVSADNESPNLVVCGELAVVNRRRRFPEGLEDEVA